jgi:TolB-like protein/cytochrome c-type biogenesis protein CcmH/NrfG
VSAEPSDIQILEQLERLVKSPSFRSSPRKLKFLKYVAEKSLAGERDRLKGYAIGVDVFDRSEDFDPQLDTIVRVQAGNLRKALKLYYLTTGQSDSVLIELPKGSYAPRFSFVDKLKLSEELDSHPEFPPTTKTNFEFKNHRSNILAGLAVIGITVLLVMMLFRSPVNSGDGFDQAASMSMGPSIALRPFSIVGNPENINENQNIEILKTGLHYELVDKISRFRNLFVKEFPEAVPGRSVDPSAAANTQFLLSGSIQPSGTVVRIISILTRTTTGEILWTKTYDADLIRAGDLLEIQSKIAVDVASSLGHPDSSINNRFQAEFSTLSDLHFEHYYCLMQFYAYTNRKSPAVHLDTRACLERATKEMPRFSSGWAALSQLYMDEEFNGFNRRKDSDPPRKRALASAERAVQMDPENAMAFQYLAIAKFWNEDYPGFRATAEKAFRLNPNDPEVLALLGGYLIRLDNSDQGKKLVEKAIAMTPSSPTWYHGSVFPYYYTRGDKETALYHAKIYYENDSLSARIVYVAALVQNGQIEDAKSVYQVTVQKYPYFPNYYDSIIKSRHPHEGMFKQLIGDLTIAGLTPVL